jgi:chromosome segregation ATPase
LPSTPVLAEVLRQCAEAGQDKGAEDKGDKDEGKMPLFWRVFGSTLLSIAALVVVTAYQSLSGNLADVRGEITHLNADLRKELGRMSEAQAELVKKDEAGARLQTVWGSIKELQEDRKELTALKERCRALVEMYKGSEAERQKLAGALQGLREQKAQEEERRALARELAGLRERLAGLEGRQRSKPGLIQGVAEPAP